jgi:hypothetical protein
MSPKVQFPYNLQITYFFYPILTQSPLLLDIIYTKVAENRV